MDLWPTAAARRGVWTCSVSTRTPAVDLLLRCLWLRRLRWQSTAAAAAGFPADSRYRWSWNSTWPCLTWWRRGLPEPLRADDGKMQRGWVRAFHRWTQVARNPSKTCRPYNCLTWQSWNLTDSQCLFTSKKYFDFAINSYAHRTWICRTVPCRTNCDGEMFRTATIDCVSTTSCEHMHK